MKFSKALTLFPTGKALLAAVDTAMTQRAIDEGLKADVEKVAQLLTELWPDTLEEAAKIREKLCTDFAKHKRFRVPAEKTYVELNKLDASVRSRASEEFVRSQAETLEVSAGRLEQMRRLLIEAAARVSKPVFDDALGLAAKLLKGLPGEGDGDVKEVQKNLAEALSVCFSVDQLRLSACTMQPAVACKEFVETTSEQTNTLKAITSTLPALASGLVKFDDEGTIALAQLIAKEPELGKVPALPEASWGEVKQAVNQRLKAVLCMQIKEKLASISTVTPFLQKILGTCEVPNVLTIGVYGAEDPKVNPEVSALNSNVSVLLGCWCLALGPLSTEISRLPLPTLANTEAGKAGATNNQIHRTAVWSLAGAEGCAGLLPEHPSFASSSRASHREVGGHRHHGGGAHRDCAHDA